MASRPKIAVVSATAVLALAATLIRPWEGYSPTPYVDIVGVLTVCYGSTKDVQQRIYSDTECDSRLRSDMGSHLVGIAKCINRDIKDNEWAAVLSLAYNVGVGAVCKSTLVRQINSGQPASTWCQQFDRWTIAGGKRVRGLVRRRAAEKQMCLGVLP